MENRSTDQKAMWALIKNTFPILHDQNPYMYDEELLTENDFYNTLDMINNYKITSTIQMLVINKIEKHLRDYIVPEFWSRFKKSSNESEGFVQFYKAIEQLYSWYTKYLNLVKKLDILRNKNNYVELIYGEKNVYDAFKLMIRATLLSQLPVDHKTIIEDFYQLALKIEDQNVNDNADQKCVGCSEYTSCSCQQHFYITNRKLVDLGLLEPLVGQVLTSLIYTYIENHIQKTTKDSFDTSYIDSLEKWLYVVVLGWLKKIYCCDVTSPITDDPVTKFQQKLRNFLYETYTKIRINQLFNIIIEHPESLPALEDLRICLPKTDLRSVLTKKLQKAMETRLLHPGVSTPDILTAYVAAIRSLRVLDPSGLLLETVTKPVHQYLRSRDDTIRCVVSSLTEEGPNDLAEELVKGEVVQTDENSPGDEDSENWETWMPDPVDADPSKCSIRRTSDIISMLVNVYGSKELFVNEYRTLLADRLLSQFSCDTEKEIRYLELLKLRFGDSPLHYCEVMLKDVADSKRINQHIIQDAEYVESNSSISAMIVSAQFWPPFKDEKLELHNKVVSQIELYTKGFETLKGNRTLCWKNHLGIVDLEIELPNRTLSLSVSPVHATTILHFEDKSEWALEDLGRVMQVPPTILRRKLGFWQSHGLIVEISTDLFKLTEKSSNRGKSISNDIIVEDYESESAMASTQDQREEELQTLWSYIVGMLMNLDSLPLERIHQMLKMFAFQGPTVECNIQELRHFLDRKVKEHQLVYSGGIYKLPKPEN